MQLDLLQQHILICQFLEAGRIIAALLAVAKDWKHPEYPSRGIVEQIK